MPCRNVVVVGASAGGVEALQGLVSGLPQDFPGTVLIVLHLSPHNPSRLHEILARSTALPVTMAKDGEAMAPGRIYVATADRHLVIDSDQHLRITRGPRENRSRPAIDTLFRSASYSFGPRVIGIVLSGALDDGTAGLWAIKDRGGLAIVQSPEDAQYSSMPESALRHVRVDYTLRVVDMPALLSRLVGQEIEQPAPPTAAVEALRTETRIALEGNGLQAGVMQLGAVSANTCPECHGVLVRIRESSLVRYRCHTGHAFSLETLLAAVNEGIDATLWAALRAIEERILLLEEMADLAHSRDELGPEKHLRERAAATGRRAQVIRQLVLEHSVKDAASEQQ
jgi:two-component system, chemotaxis family, protein-glutamate methylesterase/glutaminase